METYQKDPGDATGRAAPPRSRLELRIVNAPVEDVARALRDRELARAAARLVLTIGDEKARSERYFPRDYRVVFEPLGLREVERRSDLAAYGLSPSFVARVFAKEPDVRGPAGR